MTGGVFIKICGIRDPQTADACVALGVDALGFVFAEGSVRRIDADAAAAIVSRVPDTVETVGVFTDAPIESVIEDVTRAGIRTAQFHGERSEAELQQARDAVLALRASKGMVWDPSDPDSTSAGSFFTNPIVSETFARSLPADAPRYPTEPDPAPRVLPPAFPRRRARCRRCARRRRRLDPRSTRSGRPGRFAPLPRPPRLSPWRTPAARRWHPP